MAKSSTACMDQVWSLEHEREKIINPLHGEEQQMFMGLKRSSSGGIAGSRSKGTKQEQSREHRGQSMEPRRLLQHGGSRDMPRMTDTTMPVLGHRIGRVRT